MKALILAAGYATRLYPLTLKTPKPLLKIRERAILDYIVDRIEGLEMVDEITVITNDKFHVQFEEWAKARTNEYQGKIRLLNDMSVSLEDRRGAIGDIQLALSQGINDDVLIVAGDNLFDFNLNNFVEFAYAKKPSHSICLYLPQHNNDLNRFGIATLNADMQIVSFEEKPAQPKSNLIGTCIYFFPQEKLSLISSYLQAELHHDTPGSYIRWLTEHDKVYGRIFDGVWFDLGDFATLSRAILYFKDKTLNYEFTR